MKQLDIEDAIDATRTLPTVDELFTSLKDVGFKVLRCDQVWGEWRVVLEDNETPGKPCHGGAGPTANVALVEALTQAGINIECA